MKYFLKRTSFLPKKIKPYDGSLQRKKMSKIALIAFEKFNGQKRRCYQKTYTHYKDYGGRGLTLDYSVRDFIGWYIYWLPKFKGKNPTVGRIDHDVGYRFDNIFIQSNEDNSREGLTRNMLHIISSEIWSRQILLRDWITNEVVGEIPSLREAARKFGVSQRLIQFIVRGKYKSSKKVPYRLEYK